MAYLRGARRQERDAEIARRYEAGEDPAAIASDYGLARASVAVYANRLGAKRKRVAPKRGPREALRGRNEEISRRYATGELVEIIAADYGLKAGTIRGIAFRAGVTRRERDKSAIAERVRGTERRNKEIRALYDEGWGFQQLADRYGVSRQRIEQIIRVDRSRARSHVANGIAAGRIAPADFCALCGGSEGIGAHHPRYDRPNAVTWLCHSCHAVADVCRRQAARVAA